MQDTSRLHFGAATAVQTYQSRSVIALSVLTDHAAWKKAQNEGELWVVCCLCTWLELMFQHGGKPRSFVSQGFVE